MAGYIRNDTTNNIADGNIINAADLDGEFDAIASAFTTGGHNHDGTAQNGGEIKKLGPGQCVLVEADKLYPSSSNIINLGTSGARYKNLFIHDDAVINLGSDSDITIGYDEATTDSLKIAAKEGSGLAITLMADNGDDAGDEWKLNVADGGVITFGNDIASAGTHVTHLTLTPHATVASSKLTLAGILELSDGTAAAPSLTNTGDADAGLFFSAADTLSFTAGGIAQFLMADGVIAPVTDSDVDLGTQNEYFKDAFIDKITTTGVIELGHADQTTLSGSGGVLSVEGVAVLVEGAQTGLTTDFNTARKIGRDADNVVDFATTDDEIQFVAAGTKRVTIDANGLTVDSGSIETATIDYIDGDLAMTIADGGGVTFAQGVTITGDLTVNGTTTTVDTTNTVVKDSLLGLNNGASSNSNDSGIIIERGSTGNDALFIWDESEDKFALGTTTDNASSTGNLNMTTGTLVANIEGNVSGATTIAGTTLVGKIKNTGGNDAFTLPDDDGTAGQFLKTDAAGNLDFASVTVNNSGFDSSGSEQLTVPNGGTGATTFGSNQILIGNVQNAIQASSNLTFNGSTLDVNGAITASGDITGLTSDKRLKDFKGTIPSALEKVQKLSGYNFNLNNTAKELDSDIFTDADQVGVSAQEVLEVCPEAVKPAPIDNNYYTVQYEKLVPLLIEAIKDLKQELDKHKEGCKC